MIGAVTSSSVSSSKLSSRKYDVFLSFRGDDTRRNFTSHLYEALSQKKVETYIDYRLQKGDEISQELTKAIEDSHISIVIFSENYASSRWCLDELSKILECKKDQGQNVIPVFYNIDPSDVRKQSASNEHAFTKHEGDPRCKKWKDALTEVANLVGFDSRNRDESELIKEIVRDVLQKLYPRYPNPLKGLVGTEKNYEKVESLLNIGSSDVRIIGIWGMGGIGKTTLAKALYAKLSSPVFFERRCFLENIREQSGTQEGLNALRKKLFSESLEEENHHFDVSNLDKCRLGRKRMFIVLDDVATSEQLEYLNIEYDYLGPGSRVIVTTRDKHIFSHVDIIYEVEGLNFHDSLQLFCLNAFREKHPINGYKDLAIRANSYCKGNPLALKVLGASLRLRSKEAWKSKLKNLQKIPNMEIHKVLKLSYDDLDDSQKQIFLDIACFFKGWSKDVAETILDAFDFPSTFGIEVLLDKALVTISDDNKIEMHDLIQEMGWEVVRQESMRDTRRQSRLWEPGEVLDVLKNNRGTEAVEAIKFNSFQFGSVELSSDCFKRMTYLRYLSFHGYGNIYFCNGHGILSDKLRYLDWPGCSLESFPLTFCVEMLKQLIMPNSKLKKLWDGVQNLVNLKIFNISSSPNLIEIPDLSRAANLQVVNLNFCISLHRLNPSILSLPKLQRLCLKSCRMIEIESHNIIHSKSLCEISLDGCSSVKEFSVTSEELTWLNLAGTAIRELPSSFERNKKLEFLVLSETNIASLPTNLKELSMLKELLLYDCKNLVFLPELPPSLEKLTAHNCTSLETIFDLNHDEIVDRLPSLKGLYLENCFNLRIHPDSIGFLSSLEVLNINLSGNNIESFFLTNFKCLTKLPSSLHRLTACNCTSLDSDFTQQLVLQHMLQRVCYKLKHGLVNTDDIFIFPGGKVTDKFSFHSAETSVTIPCLSKSDLCGFICCLILSNEVIVKYGGILAVSCFIHEQGNRVQDSNKGVKGVNLKLDHMLFWYEITAHRFWKRNNCCNNLSFQFKLQLPGIQSQKEWIKGCGVYPVYASELESIAQVSQVDSKMVIDELQPKENEVQVRSSIENEDGEQEQHPIKKLRTLMKN